MKDLKEFKRIAELHPRENAGKRNFPHSLKIDIVDFHYSSGMTMAAIGMSTGISPSTLGKWKKTHGHDQTCFIHGNTARNDVRTQCIAVKKCIESGLSLEDAATEYNVGISTISRWKTQWKNTYNDHINNLPDGVPYLVKEDRQVYGMDNVRAIINEMSFAQEAIKLMIESQHIGKSTKKIVKAELKKIESEKNILKKAEEIMKGK